MWLEITRPSNDIEAQEQEMERTERRARKGDKDKEGIRTAKGEGEDRRTTGNRKAKEERGMDMVADIEVWRGRGTGRGKDCQFDGRWQKDAMVWRIVLATCNQHVPCMSWQRVKQLKDFIFNASCRLRLLLYPFSFLYLSFLLLLSIPQPFLRAGCKFNQWSIFERVLANATSWI